MYHFAGLDVSLEETSICIVDDEGKVVREAKVASEPEAIIAVLRRFATVLKLVGLEAGPLSPWLHGALRAAELPALCLETRQVKAALSAMRNKTDRGDARGIAQIVRANWFQEVHVKSPESQELRMLLSNRKTLQRRALDIENAIRGTLKAFGLKVGKVSKRNFEHKVLELLDDRPRLRAITVPLLKARAVLLEEFERLHRMVLDAVRPDPICRRFMSIPGVGPVIALTYKTGLDDPHRFAKSKTVGAHFGLTPRKYRSGEIDYDGHITKCGDERVRTALYEAANVLLTRTQRWSSLRAWAMRIAKKRGLKRARVALARKLAVILHRMWLDGTEFAWRAEAPAVA